MLYTKGMSAQPPKAKDQQITRSYTWRFHDQGALVTSAQQLTQILLRQRGVTTKQEPEFFTPNYEHSLHDPVLLRGMEAAVARIDHALSAKQRMAIYGDYDIDGITATALLCDVLSQLGAQVEPYIPDRFEEGYGLNIEALKRLKNSGVDLVISVDCGITAANEVAQAKDFGLDLIVTDHHTVPEVTPDAAIACINPRLPDDTYPYKDLAGVGVAFKLASALARTHPDTIKPGHEKWLMDLVALGTVCDVVPLVGENRALVQFGLTVLRKSPRKGIKALAEVSGSELGSVTASDLGFRLGPRLNAAGRLEHASKALELLMTTDTTRAKELADMLNTLNRERQDDTLRVFAEAMSQAEQYPDDKILVLSDPSWSHGIVGLVASRVSEATHKPTIILQELDDKTKGSARSVGTFNIIEAITASGELLERFGGHAFAAGMTLKTSAIAPFRAHINQYAHKHVQDLGSNKELAISCRVAADLLSLGTYLSLRGLEPFGNGNSQPVFVTQLKLTRLRPVGSDLKHFQMTFLAGKTEVGAIAFGAAGRWPWLKLGTEVEVAYRLGNNLWQGVDRLQLEVADLRPLTPGV